MKYLSVGLMLAFFVIACGKDEKPIQSSDLSSDGQFAPSPGQETTATSIPIGIQVGQRAPDFALETITGEPFKLSEQRGKTRVSQLLGNMVWALSCRNARHGKAATGYG